MNPGHLLERVRAGARRHLLASWYGHRFIRDRRARQRRIGTDLVGVRCPTEPELVSVVLPVFNGERYLAEAAASVLEQTRRELELIVVDDGSTDATPDLLGRLAASDPRVRVLRQENRGLPVALSSGFRAARGAFLTWLSDDNRMAPRFLDEMVACLGRHPGWDMTYGNLELIDDNGHPLEQSQWYWGYQRPRGSARVHMPVNLGELNTWPNNTVGAAFLYRDRVAWLLGDYSRHRFTVEDYDYWMQVNELCRLEHADFDQPLYQYRIHGRSLTAREAELGILARRERLMVFDDFRRDFALWPLIWWVAPEDRTRSFVAALLNRARAAGDLVMAPGELDPSRLPPFFQPSIRLCWSEDPSEAAEPSGAAAAGALTVLLTGRAEGLPRRMPEGWNLCASVAEGAELRATDRSHQGWLGLVDPAAAFAALDVRARAEHLRRVEAELFDPVGSTCEVSVVLCTYRRSARLAAALDSVRRQTLDPTRFEILVVNNDPDVELDEMVRPDPAANDGGPTTRLLLAPHTGLSHARNAGVAAARGAITCFLDDDAVAEEDWLEGLLEAYRAVPGAGVIGGPIRLLPPPDAPPWLDREAWPYWSHFEPGVERPTVVGEWWRYPWGANWSARRDVLLAIGGFRCGYGRRGTDYGGGEEVVAAALAGRLGSAVVVTPHAAVRHDVEPSRFTRANLRRMVRAATRVSYRMQHDLYLPKATGPVSLAVQLARRAIRLAAWWRLSPFGRRETADFLAAEIGLAVGLVAEYADRFRSRRGWRPDG